MKNALILSGPGPDRKPVLFSATILVYTLARSCLAPVRIKALFFQGSRLFSGVPFRARTARFYTGSVRLLRGCRACFLLANAAKIDELTCLFAHDPAKKSATSHVLLAARLRCWGRSRWRSCWP